MRLSIFKSRSGAGFAWLLFGLSIFAQTPETSSPSSPTKLALKAQLILSPEFCATKKRHSFAAMEVVGVGKAACSQLYPALVGIFSDLQQAENVPAAGSSTAQITLIPRFIDIIATQPPFVPSPSKRKLVVLLEWTVKDTMGRTIWLQTVQGTSELKPRGLGGKKYEAALVDAAISDLAKDSVDKISAAREIRQLSQ
jgi:hypothetical protein